MTDYYYNIRNCIDNYNFICNRIKTSTNETTDEEDEFIQNFCMYFAHALIKDTGYGQNARDELRRIAAIINDVLS